MAILKDNDISTNTLKGKKIAIVGYGNQARAQALNIRDSDVGHVAVALRRDSASSAAARADGFSVNTLEEAVGDADIIMMLIPDEIHGDVYEKAIKPHMKKGAALGFSHGFSIRFGLVKPAQDIDVILMAPKGPGHTLRTLYEDGLGMPCVVGVEQDVTGNAQEIALAYAAAIGCGRAGILLSSFAEECETDLFSEQVILCGGLPALIKAGFETLVEAGYSPEVAYIECLHEVKQIADLLWEGGLAHMDTSISNTAEYGGYRVGNRIVSPAVKNEMQAILEEIKSGKFAHDFSAEVAAGLPEMERFRRSDANHPIEDAGKRVRALMPWFNE